MLTFKVNFHNFCIFIQKFIKRKQARKRNNQNFSPNLDFFFVALFLTFLKTLVLTVDSQAVPLDPKPLSRLAH